MSDEVVFEDRIEAVRAALAAGQLAREQGRSAEEQARAHDLQITRSVYREERGLTPIK